MQMEGESEGRSWLSGKEVRSGALLAGAAGGGLFLLKLIFGLVTRSTAVLSESVNSFTDFISALSTFLLITRALKPADADHPFGHGKLENLAGLLQMAVVVGLGIWIFLSAVERLFNPVELKMTGSGIVVMAVSMGATFLVWQRLAKLARRTGSVALEASSVEFSMDLFTNTGVILALALIYYTGLNLIDPVVALMVLAIIFYSAKGVARRALGELLDESLPSPVRVEINQIINKTLTSHYPKLVGFHKLRTRRSGLRKLIDLHLLGCKKLELVEAHELAHNLEGNLKNCFPDMDVLIHSEPCEEDCETCQRIKR